MHYIIDHLSFTSRIDLNEKIIFIHFTVTFAISELIIMTSIWFCENGVSASPTPPNSFQTGHFHRTRSICVSFQTLQCYTNDQQICKCVHSSLTLKWQQNHPILLYVRTYRNTILYTQNVCIHTLSSGGHWNKCENVALMFFANLGAKTSFSAPNWCLDCLTMLSITYSPGTLYSDLH